MKNYKVTLYMTDDSLLGNNESALRGYLSNVLCIPKENITVKDTTDPEYLYQDTLEDLLWERVGSDDYFIEEAISIMDSKHGYVLDGEDNWVKKS